MDTFQTQRLILRRMTKVDFNFFVTLIKDDLITKYFSSFKYIKRPKYFFLNEIISKQNHGNLFLVICDKSYTPIGILFAYAAHNQWLVEYALLSQYRRQGFVTELLTAICQNDFDFLVAFKTNKSLISSLLFEVKNDNIASQKLIQKVAQNLNLKLDVNNKFYTLNLI